MATAVIEQPKTESEPKPWIPLMERRHRITVEQYHRILDSGIFGPEPKVELLEGVIVRRTVSNPSHSLSCDLIPCVLRDLRPEGHFISRRSPLAIRDRNGEPEPDVVVLRGKIRDYTDRERTPADAALLIEVADTSYDYDRYAKWVTYAAARVPVYWILDLDRRQLEVHTEPTGQGEAAVCSRAQIFGPDDEVPLILDGREVGRFPVKEILP
jgi:Uma2 family endonuclease